MNITDFEKKWDEWSDKEKLMFLVAIGACTTLVMAIISHKMTLHKIYRLLKENEEWNEGTAILANEYLKILIANNMLPSLMK